MRISSTLFVTLSVALPLALTACSNKEEADNEPFDTFQDCYDDHQPPTASFTVQEAIVICCLDHPIGGTPAPTCPKIQVDCVTHVRAALDPSILDADITAACMTYISQK